jgi:hypothetical protein
MAALLWLSACGGSASETPFPPEPLDVNLEAEDLEPARPISAREAKGEPLPTASASSPRPSKPR